MGRTRLFQRAGSPLIQGQSRTERPFAASWVTASVVTLSLLFGVAIVLSFGEVTGVPAYLQQGWSFIRHAGIPALAAAALGVWLARNMGWRKQWLAGASTGVLVAFVALAIARVL